MTNAEIESLGYKYDPIAGPTAFRSLMSRLGPSTGDDANLIIDYDERDDECLIYWKDRRAGEDVIFNGFIETIEDLKDLLTNKLRIPWE